MQIFIVCVRERKRDFSNSRWKFKNTVCLRNLAELATVVKGQRLYLPKEVQRLTGRNREEGRGSYKKRWREGGWKGEGGERHWEEGKDMEIIKIEDGRKGELWGYEGTKVEGKINRGNYVREGENGGRKDIFIKERQEEEGKKEWENVTNTHTHTVA